MLLPHFKAVWKSDNTAHHRFRLENVAKQRGIKSEWCFVLSQHAIIHITKDETWNKSGNWFSNSVEAPKLGVFWFLLCAGFGIVEVLGRTDSLIAVTCCWKNEPVNDVMITWLKWHSRVLLHNNRFLNIVIVQLLVTRLHSSQQWRDSVNSFRSLKVHIWTLFGSLLKWASKERFWFCKSSGGKKNIENVIISHRLKPFSIEHRDSSLAKSAHFTFILGALVCQNRELRNCRIWIKFKMYSRLRYVLATCVHVDSCVCARLLICFFFRFKFFIPQAVSSRKFEAYFSFTLMFNVYFRYAGNAFFPPFFYSTSFAIASIKFNVPSSEWYLYIWRFY